MCTSPVKVDIDGPVAWLTLNRPESMNAFNRALLQALDERFRAAANDPAVRVVVITGTAGVFSAGGDLKEILGTDGTVHADSLVSFVEQAGRTFDLIAGVDIPVIAAVNGLAVAGGMELALACDLIVAAQSARIGDAHSNYGILPGGGGAARLVRVVGPTVAKYLAYTGVALPATDLVPLGLVNEVVADDQLVPRADALARQLAGKSAAGLAHMKRLIDDGLEQPLAEALRSEHQALAVHARHADMREGLTAFREHRKPRFTARTQRADAQPPPSRHEHSPALTDD